MGNIKWIMAISSELAVEKKLHIHVIVIRSYFSSWLGSESYFQYQINCDYRNTNHL